MASSKASNRPSFVPADFFVLRTPLLPFDGQPDL